MCNLYTERGCLRVAPPSLLSARHFSQNRSRSAPRQTPPRPCQHGGAAARATNGSESAEAWPRQAAAGEAWRYTQAASACTAAVPGGETVRRVERPRFRVTCALAQRWPPGRDARATNGSEHAEA
ncbi:MAG TPA: hypothetical protein VH599_15915 [Ktedonobacterales bacterium]